MSGFLIAVFVILWVVSAINSVRKAVAKAQAAAGGPDAVRAQIEAAAAQSDSLARTAAAQRAARALRMRIQTAAAPSSPAVIAQKPAAIPYLAPPADQAMTSLTPMQAPTMPAFDSPGLDASFAVYSPGAPGSSAGGATGAALAGRQFLVTEGASVAASAIIAAAIIGPPVGLRSGNQSASDW